MRTSALLALVASLAAAALAGQAVVVELRPEALLEPGRVRLGEVATVSGPDLVVAARVRALDLGPTPPPGAEREITRAYIASRLGQLRLGPRAVAWRGAQRVRVALKVNRLSGSALAQAAVDHLRKLLPWPDEDLVVEVRQAPADLAFTGPTDGLEVHVSVAPGTRLLGAVPCSVGVTRNGRLAGRTNVVLGVRVFQNLVVARRRIRQGEILTKDHVRLQRCELKSLTTEALSDLREVVGREARHDIQPFALITRRMLRAPRVVRRGALVRLVAESPLMRITARGVAQQDGAVGQWIPVVNVDSRKVVYGRVRDAETVEVSF